MISLTPRQQDVLRFIIGFQAAHGRTPSYVEIAKGIGLSGENSKGVICLLIARLQERGALSHRCTAARAIKVLQPVSIPRAPDGEPLYFVRTGGPIA